MNHNDINKRLFSFIEQSTSPFHAVSCMENSLIDHGFIKLNEGLRWSIKPGGRYFVVRNGSVIAFTCGASSDLMHGFRIIGAHSDSPSLQIKPNHQNKSSSYLLLGVEKYGGPILSTWFDRELSLAGRVVIKTTDNKIKPILVDFEKPLLYIPSLAIHLNRKVNDDLEINVQNDISPILAQSVNDQLPDLNSILINHIKETVPNIKVHSITGFDLFCYDINKPSFFGINNQFISAPRLDNLLSCFVGLQSIVQAEEHTNALFICTNHEEIGSRSESGALGSFLPDILSRLLVIQEENAICHHNSFLLSLDNAHACHPNFKNKSDPDHEILLNSGPVIKINANQRYSSTALTASVIRHIAAESGVNSQNFVMRSDMACGSTIGPLSSAQTGIAAVDVGAPTWGMHSIREVTGHLDPVQLLNLSRTFVNLKTLPSFR